MSTCLTVSYHVGNELEHFIHFVSDYTILQDVFPDNAAKRKIKQMLTKIKIIILPVISNVNTGTYILVTATVKASN